MASRSWRADRRAVSRIYVERHFPHGAKAAMDVLVGARRAYRQSITGLV
jgi:predicted metalloendopeptidase